MVSTLMERWLKNCRGDGLFLSQCPSIRQKPDNLTYFFVAGPWHWRFIRGLCGGHPGFRRYPNTSLQVMHNGNILYTVSQRCQCCSVILWLGRHPASVSAVSGNYLLSYCVLQFPAPSAPPPVQRPGAVPQAQVSHVQDGECPHAEVTPRIWTIEHTDIIMCGKTSC